MTQLYDTGAICQNDKINGNYFDGFSQNTPLYLKYDIYIFLLVGLHPFGNIALSSLVREYLLELKGYI